MLLINTFVSSERRGTGFRGGANGFQSGRGEPQPMAH
jgi:hypothetical protein